MRTTFKGVRRHCTTRIPVPCPHDPIPQFFRRKCGKSLLYTREGNVESNIAVIALHGSGTHRDFRYLGGNLPYDFIRFDLPGYGGSPLELNSSPTSRFFTNAVWEAVDSLLPASANIIVLGHSQGCRVAVDMAVDRQSSVLGIAMLAPMTLRPSRGVGGDLFYPFMTWTAGMLDNTFWGPSISASTIASYRYLGFKLTEEEVKFNQKRIALLDFEGYRQDIAKLTCPVFLAYAKDDRMIEVEKQQELGVALPRGPRVVFESGGHNIQKYRAMEISIALETWIKGLKVNDTIDKTSHSSYFESK